eukprot:1156973-Pelagomonas_calceolata.AAC.7
MTCPVCKRRAADSPTWLLPRASWDDGMERSPGAQSFAFTGLCQPEDPLTWLLPPIEGRGHRGGLVQRAGGGGRRGRSRRTVAVRHGAGQVCASSTGGGCRLAQLLRRKVSSAGTEAGPQEHLSKVVDCPGWVHASSHLPALMWQ